ncbi:hypothetical protein AKJ09_04345 [Labilithrix luteola]|uniref:Uncharacterized protein n=2 Tax=Labilithrix luteola TaxID=1391654 RepID=A0A0K1PWB5_9BACT|nr:hypothetical protein AKJ09_04345 [Labilithrix luteola]
MPAPEIPQWPSVDVDTTADLTGVAYGNGTFVVVGNANVVWTSTDDGATWTSHATATPFRGVSFTGLAKFMAWGANVVALSADGVSWESHPVDKSTNSKEIFFGAAWGNGEFAAYSVAPNNGGDVNLWHSPDALTWTTNLDLPGTRAIGYGIDFVAVGDEGARVSLDGITWTTGEFEGAGVALAATGHGVFAASAQGAIEFSIDGKLWEKRALPFAGQSQGDYFNGMGSGAGGSIAAVGLASASSVVVAVSADGNTWSRRELPLGPHTLNAVAGSDTSWVAVGTHGLVLRSPN